MTFKSAGTQVIATTGTVLSYTMPAGVVTTDTVLFICSWGSSASSTISVGVPSGASTGVVVASRNDTNLGWSVVSVTGVVTGDVVTLTFSLATGTKLAQAFVFDNPVGVVGSVGNRAAVSSTSQTAPAITVPSGTPVLLLAVERTTANPTTVSSVSVSSSETVTQLSFGERVGDPDVSYYLGRFVTTVSPTGSATITYSGGSTNGAAVLIAESVTAPVTPSIAPSFSGNTTGLDFSASVIIPGVPAAFKSAGPMVNSVSSLSFVIPAGTTTSDYVYALLTWGTNSSRTADWGGRTVAEVVSLHADGNMSWGLFSFTGTIAGSTVTVALDGGMCSGRVFVFDKPLSTAGSIGKRSSSVTTVTAPAVPIATNTPTFLFAVERTLADGTLVTNAVNSLGGTVTQLAYEETPNDPDISMYLARVDISNSTSSGDTTLTYNSASGNAAAVAIPAVRGAVSIAPVFGGTISGLMASFTARVTPATGLIRAYVGRPDSTIVRVKSLTQGVTNVRLACSVANNMASPVFGISVMPDAQGYAHLECSVPQANTRYYWQIEADGVLVGTPGESVTWPQAGVPLPRAALMVGGCTKGYGSSNSGQPSNPDTFTFMRNKTDEAGVRARLWIDLGDEIYPCSQGSPNGTIMPGNPAVIRNWWEGQHQQSQRLAFHKVVPAVHTYSDNDFIGSNSDPTMAPHVADISNAVRRQVLCDAPFASTDGKGLYWSALFGRVLLIHTDGRTYMGNTMAPQSTSKSLLGSSQKSWLLAQLARTDCVGIIWFHDNQWVGNPAVSTARPAVDNWQAFANERQDIADFIVANDVPLMLYVQADNHDMAFDDGSHNAYGGFPFFVCAPVFQDAQPFTPAISGSSWPIVNSGSQKYFGWIELTDDGVTVTANISGIDVTGGTLITRVTGVVTATAQSNEPRAVHEFYGNIDADDVYPKIIGGEPGPPGPPGPAGTGGGGLIVEQDPANTDLLLISGDAVAEDPTNSDLLIVGDA